MERHGADHRGAINIISGSGYADLSDKPTSLAGINAAEANALTTAASSVFFESFDGDSPLNQWTILSGVTPSIVAVADSYSGGNILRIGDNAGNDDTWLAHKRLIPFDPAKTYQIMARMRRTAGNGTTYLASSASPPMA